MRELLAELLQTLERGRPVAFCSVVATRGSTPQKAGAAMLVHADGSQTGTLGGGCVEADVKRRALQALNEPNGATDIFSFCLDDDYGWDDGLICGGRMDTLVAPLGASALERECGAAYYRRYRELAEGPGGAEVVALKAGSLPPGARFLFDATGSLMASLADAPPPREALAALRPLTERPRPCVHKEFAYLPILPRITLLIVGGGHVGQAVAELASRVEFDVWALDDRETYVSPNRFPTAKRLIVGDIGRMLQELAPEIHGGVFCLIVTRGHNHDEEALYRLAQSKAGYVGMIGSKRKIKMIFEDLGAKGVPEEALARVHAPLGLPIGSQTVAEIAVSIVAELICCRNIGQ
jgi:xanthine dehydrogenase accessory factor